MASKGSHFLPCNLGKNKRHFFSALDMIVADFHVHSTFSVDGMSTMEQHCIMAMQKGIKKICFTEHVDYNIAEYNVGKTNY